jgi:hypothetical protein
MKAKRYKTVKGLVRAVNNAYLKKDSLEFELWLRQMATCNGVSADRLRASKTVTQKQREEFRAKA